MELYFILALVFVSVSAVSLIALSLFTGKGQVKARLKALEERNNVRVAKQVDKESALKKGLKLVSPAISERSPARDLLERAGYRSREDVYTYYGIRVVSAILLPAAAIPTSLHFHLQSTEMVIVLLAAAILGWIWPTLWLAARVKRRREEIRRAVPHALDLIVVCVEGGLSFTAAIQKVADDISLSSRALGAELRLVTQEVLVGKSKTDAFRSLANRTGVDDLRSLAVTLIQAEKLGTSVANSLRVLADSMRFKRRQRAEEMANKATVKLVFPLVLLIFPQLLVIIAGPAVITLIKNLKQVAQ
ncbi:MAG: type II secretion system F family protein [candidate division Zixibacteria bacterium]|nr:type II secretion system F family protein [candidate division Zixibacteria bacterium]